MLQALKNLEARAPRRTAGAGVLAHLAETPQPPRETAPAAVPVAPLPREAAPSAPPDDVIDKLLDRREPAPVATSTSRPAPQRDPTPLERSIQRTLNDAARLPQIRQMADRLLADARQTSSRTLLLCGVGPECTTHEALLYAGAVLAQPAGGLLLVDADMSRRVLTTALQAGDAAGLCDAMEGGDARGLCRGTVFDGLSLLPAGMPRGRDFATAGSRLGELLHELSGDYRLLLIDGGRTDDPAAATLARLCDATYLVVPLGRVAASQAQAALRELRAAGARILGCIAT